MRITIGSKVRHTLFGGEQLEGVIEDIEICRQGEKYGRPVKNADISKHHGVVSLSNGHWCYFYQIKELINE